MLKKSDWLTRPADEAAAETFGGAEKFSAADREKHQIIGEYELLEELGGGGMGRVFRAIHRKLKRQVAVVIAAGEPAIDRGDPA